MDYGPPVYVKSQKKTQLIRYRSNQNPGNSYLFFRHKSRIDANGGEKSYWRCTECKKLKERFGVHGAMANISVHRQGEDEVILNDPEAGHHAQCVALGDAEIESNQILLETKDELRRGIKRPLEAYTSACAEISKRFQDNVEHDAVVDAMPKYKEVRRSLYQNAEHGIIPIADHVNLPVEYRKTYRARYSDAANPHFNDQWLIFANNDLLIFSSDLDLEVLHQSTLWIVDGTFKVCPPSFKQVYTILGHGQFDNEAIPLVFALVNGKTQALYDLLLSTVRLKLQHKFGTVGQMQAIIADFEIAFHLSARNIFPLIRLRGCNFHFGQALVRHFEGLKHYLEDRENEVACWFGCVKALALLPECLVRLAWDVVLIPKLNNVVIPIVPLDDQNRLQQFSNYFLATWLQSAVFPLKLWNHWDNSGPRTTNHAEGYHSLLNRSDIDQLHPSLKNFLSKLQLMHNRWQQQIGRLQRNIVAPEHGDPFYTELHNRIVDARNTFYQRTLLLWDFVGFMPHLMQPADFQFLSAEINNYLHYVRHLVGKKNKV